MRVKRNVKRLEIHQGIVSTSLKDQKVTSFFVVVISVAIAVVKTKLCKKIALTFCYKGHDAVCRGKRLLFDHVSLWRENYLAQSRNQTKYSFTLNKG